MENGCSQSGRSVTKGAMSGRIRAVRIPLGSLPTSSNATRGGHFNLTVSPTPAKLKAFCKRFRRCDKSHPLSTSRHSYRSQGQSRSSSNCFRTGLLGEMSLRQCEHDQGIRGHRCNVLLAVLRKCHLYFPVAASTATTELPKSITAPFDIGLFAPWNCLFPPLSYESQ